MSGEAPVAGAWHRPASLAEALAMRARAPSPVVPAAGCTDLMVGWNAAAGSWPPVLDLSALPELNRIEVDGEGVTIGAAVPCTRFAAHPVVAARLPMLVASARQTGSVAIQNRATLGGNIMNASPAADNPPVLLAYGARVTLASTRGTRTVDYAGFHAGYKRTLAAADELLVSVTVPFPPPQATVHYRKVGTRRAQAISKVALAALLVADGDGRVREARFAFASMGPVPLLAPALAACLHGRPLAGVDAGEVAQALAGDLSPQDDIRSSAAYRRQVAVNLAMAAIAEGAAGVTLRAPAART